MAMYQCICGEKFEFSDEVNIVPNHFIKDEKLCPGSGDKVKINLYEETTGNCPLGLNPPADCGNCGRPFCLSYTDGCVTEFER